MATFLRMSAVIYDVEKQIESAKERYMWIGPAFRFDDNIRKPAKGSDPSQRRVNVTIDSFSREEEENRKSLKTNRPSELSLVTNGYGPNQECKTCR